MCPSRLTEVIVRQLSNRFGDDVDALDKSTNFFLQASHSLSFIFLVEPPPPMMS